MFLINELNDVNIYFTWHYSMSLLKSQFLSNNHFAENSSNA